MSETRLNKLETALRDLTIRQNSFHPTAEGFVIGSTRLLEKLVTDEYHLLQRDSEGVETDLAAWGSLGVIAGTGLNIIVRAGRARIDQAIYNFPTHTDLGPLLAASTYRVYVSVAGIITAAVVGAYPLNAIPLAVVVTGAADITTITDERCLHYEDTAAGAAAPHAILDGGVSHTDSALDAVSIGSIIIGNDTPAWDELVRTVPAGVGLRNLLGLDFGDTTPGWKVTLDANNPADIAAVASPGTSLIAAHRDHVHAHPDLGDLHTGYLTPAEHTAIGDAAPHHPAMTLDLNTEQEFTIVGQVLSYDVQVHGMFLGGPVAGVPDEPTFRALDVADLPVEAIVDGDFAAGEGFMRKTGAGTYIAHKSNLASAGDPGVNDDAAAGYSVGSVWINTTLDKVWQCVDSTNGTAVWKDLSTAGGAGGSSIQDVDADTKVQTEEAADEDKIRFDTGGSERAVLDSTALDLVVPVKVDTINEHTGAAGVTIDDTLIKDNAIYPDAGKTDIRIVTGGGGGDSLYIHGDFSDGDYLDFQHGSNLWGFYIATDPCFFVGAAAVSSIVTFKADTMTEYTGAAGVTVEGVLAKDSYLQLSEIVAPAGVANKAIIYAKEDADTVTKLYYKRSDNTEVGPLGAAAAGNVATDTIWDALGDTVYGTGADTGLKLAGNITATKKFLSQTGDGAASAAPSWEAILAADIPDISATYLTPAAHTAIGDGAPHHARDHAMTGTSDHYAGYWKAFYSDGSGDVQEFALGSAGQVFTSNGAAAAPSFQDAAGGGSMATDALWAALGDIPYASADNTGVILSGNITTTKKFLRQTGTGVVSAAPAWDTIADADVPATHSGSSHAALPVQTGSIIPNADSAIDLGSSAPKYFANAYVDKVYLNATATLDGSVAGQVTLTGDLKVSKNIGLSGTSPTTGCGIYDASSQAGTYASLNLAPSTIFNGNSQIAYGISGGAVGVANANRTDECVYGLYFFGQSTTSSAAVAVFANVIGCGVFTQAYAINTSQQTVTKMAGLDVASPLWYKAAGATIEVTSYMGLNIEDPASAYIHNAYGIKVADITLGHNANYIAWFGGATPQVRIDGGAFASALHTALVLNVNGTLYRVMRGADTILYTEAA